MNLAPMTFKGFVWPHNPRVYTITFERKMANYKVPFGRHYLQSLGQTRRVLRGEGEFVGEGAYDKFKELASIFYEETSGLTDKLEERANGAAAPSGGTEGGGQAAYHTVARGDTLWAIANRYGVSLSAIIQWNPQIKNPNLIRPGERVRVSG